MPSSTELPILQELLCQECGLKSVIAFGDPIPHCPNDNTELHLVDTFRDRRRVPAPVRRDRRQSEPGNEAPAGVQAPGQVAPDPRPE